MGLFGFGKKKDGGSGPSASPSKNGGTAGIYNGDSWSIGEAQVEGFPLVIRARTSLPSVPDRQIYEDLIVIAWPYQTDTSGMPSKEVNQQTQDFENALEVAIESKGIGVQAACLTGKGSKEWRYYTYDKDEFMSKLNSGLVGHPVYPIEISFFKDPEWGALAELAPNA